AEPPTPLQAAQGRHFFGHGVFLPDGQRMVATENHYEAGYGVLGVYDTSPGGNFRRIGEFETGGIGPHEAVLLNDGRTVCVANGGILTHPDYGKLELNLRSEEHTSELQSRENLVCRLLLEKKKKIE